jgi:hypothetical protein
MVASVRGFMDDSDAKNIERVGHRRWCLNPAMLKTGFGSSGKYAAMWSIDTSRSEVPDYDFVSFPPPGLTPVGCFMDHYAWSISLNPKKYQPPTKEGVKIQVRPARYNARSGKLDTSGEPLPLSFSNVSLEGIGIPNCIIFRPGGFKVMPGGTYWVEISGLSDSGGKEAKVGYLVCFVALG